MLYRMVNQKVKRWWYYVELRKRMQHMEARTRERRSIRDMIRRLRLSELHGGFVWLGRYGGTHFYAPNERIEGIDSSDVEILRYMGVPIVDTRTVSEDRVMDILHLPYPLPQHCTPRPGWSEARIRDLAPRFAELGATLINF